MAGIIWLASYPKSGNTWLRAFLANLFAGGDRPVRLNDLPNYAYGDNNLLHYRDFTGRPLESFTEEEVARLRPQIHAWIASARPHEVFVKTHNAVLKIHGSPLITPSATAGAIYVARNPLDVAVSFAHHYGMSLDKAVGALCNPQFALLPAENHATQYLGSWSHHVTSWLQAPGLKVHGLRFEDLVGNPKKAFATIVRFLGLPEDPAGLEKAIEFSSFKELVRQERESGFIEAQAPDRPFFRAGKVGIWRDQLNDRQVQRLIETHGAIMRSLGYLDAEGKSVF